jgi:hypothetical protein
MRQWLPNAALSRLWLAAAVICAAVWVYLLSEAGNTLATSGATGIATFIGSALLLGLAYGSLGLSVFVLARTAALALERVPLGNQPPLQLRVALLMFAVHIGSVGMLALLGVWRQPWPWFLGLVPFLWS